MTAHTFALLPRSMEMTPAELARFDPRPEINAFRTALNRAGGRFARGWLIAFMDGEFGPESETFRIHFHGVVTDEMVGVLDGLRTHRNYRSARPRDAPPETKGPQRLEISRDPIANLPRAFSYQIKSFWPSRYFGPVGGEGKSTRCRRQRIREPFHSLALLWRDRWSLAETTLLYRLSVINHRLQPTGPAAYTKGHTK